MWVVCDQQPPRDTAPIHRVFLFCKLVAFRLPIWYFDLGRYFCSPSELQQTDAPSPCFSPLGVPFSLFVPHPAVGP